MPRYAVAKAPAAEGPSSSKDLFVVVAKNQEGKGKKKKRKRNKARELREAVSNWHRRNYVPGEDHPEALAGEDAFLGATKETPQTKDQKKEWLESQETYQIHRPARKKYPRRQFLVYSIDEQWQMDLSDMTWHKKVNGGMGWMMFCIDVLSRYCWVTPLKRKTMEESARGLKLIFDRVIREGEHTIPKVLYTDQGTEFDNKAVKALLNSYPIPPRLHQGYSKMKASLAERVQRTIKSRLWKHFPATGSYRWVDIIDDIVQSYNHSRHSSIKRTPASVNKSNEQEVWDTLYGDWDKARSRFEQESDEAIKESYYKFKVGDVVRLSKQGTIFSKGYLPQWSHEWFKIRARDPGPPQYYRLEQYDGKERLDGTFYKEELQKVEAKDIKNTRFRIEKIISRVQDPNNKSRKLVLVKWFGWPDSYNEWLPESEVKDL